MNKTISFLKRYLALALALVLLVSSANLGMVLRATAADAVETTEGQLVAANYSLTDAEKALLGSGLFGAAYSYTEPSGELVSVDADTATITAKTYTTGSDVWTPVSAEIKVGSAVKETVILTDGKGTYDPSVGNAFSVEVTYELKHTVAAATQSAILAAPAALKTGVANLAAGYKADTNLGVVASGMDALVTLKNGITISIPNFGNITAGFSSAEAKSAVSALESQYKKNGGKLDLQVMNEAYVLAAETGKVEYLLKNGAAYQAKAAETYNYLNAINSDSVITNDTATSFLEAQDPVAAQQWKAMVKILGTLVSELNAIKDDWNVPTAALKAELSAADYAALEALVAALGETTTGLTVNESLTVAKTVLQHNMAMWNVDVVVTLNTVAADNTVREYSTTTKTLTLGDGVSKADILAEITAEGIVADAIASWGTAYVDGKFEAVISALPETLDADITYTVTYSPKNYTVDLAGEKNEYPYGYQLTLPVHEDSTKAYDYTVNDKSYAQGMVITVEGDTKITRTAGKAYTSTDLYSLIADNYGNDIAAAILKSGALKDNEVINVRKPDANNVEELLHLEDGTLTADKYSAAYQGKEWVPYTYGAVGNENTFSGSTAAWSGNDAKVQYKLTLDNFTVAKVNEVLEMAKTLKAEADEQTRVLDALAKNYDTMGQLDKTKLGALNGVIDVTDFTPGDGTDTDAKNLELRAYFKNVVGGIIANNLDGNNMLKIYNMLGEYNINGLRYYYNNSAAIINEINSLSGYLDDLLADEEKEAALGIMVSAAGFPEYADKISNLQSEMASVKAALTAPNAAIDLNSDKVGKLIVALTAEGDAGTNGSTVASPYLISEILTALDDSNANVQIIIITPAGVKTVTSASVDKGTVWSAEANAALIAAKDADVAELLGANAAFYNVSTLGQLPAVGTELNQKISITIEYTEKTYTVSIGDYDQTISISDLEIDLPKHPLNGWTYIYTVDGVETKAETYTFTTEQLARLFTNGSYTITRTALDEAKEKLEDKFGEESAFKNSAEIVEDANGVVTGLNFKIQGTADGFETFITDIALSGYSYIALNGKALLEVENNTTQLSLQTLIDAVLADDDFSNESLVDLGENKQGTLTSAKITLGNDKDNLDYENLDMNLELTSVPAAVVTAANYLKTASPYITFRSGSVMRSNGNKLIVEVNLPDKVYGAYAAALIATGNADKADVNGLSQGVAMQFLYDYLTAFTGSEMDINTYINTIEMMGVNRDFTNYKKYNDTYLKGIKAFNDYFTISIDDNGTAIDFSAPANKLVDGIINALKLSADKANYLRGLIKEYDTKEGATGDNITFNAQVVLKNSNKTYEALIIDTQASGVVNKFAAPSSEAALAQKTSALAGYSAVMLLDNVDSNLTFSGTTILDLNGKTINGNVTSTGSLFIIDSSMGTYDSGMITGNVSGKVSIFGGKYNADVSAYLKDGYYKDGTTVRNALYHIEKTDEAVTFVLNANVYKDEHVEGYLPNVRALAIDIASDLMLNYMFTASVSVKGKELVDVKVEDLVGLYAGDTVNGLIKQMLNWVTIGEAGYENDEGFEALVNLLIADLLNFEGITEALTNGTALVSHDVTLKPWTIEIDHVNENDSNYATINVKGNDKLAKTSKVAIVVESTYALAVAEITGELAKIVVADETYAMVDITKPTYSDKTLSLKASAKAAAYIDMSVNEDYATILSVILAYANASKRDAVASAINSGDIDALKAVIDETTVKELFTSLKAMARTVDFVEMAKAVGVDVDNVDVKSAANLEGLFHDALCAAGKALEIVNTTGRDSKLGSLYNAEYGYYELTKADIDFVRTFSARGYSALIDLTADQISLNVKLFATEADCLWGDANHDGEITNHDASMVFEYFMKDGGADAPEICLIRTDVDGDGKITNHDASLIFECFMSDDPSTYKFPVEK